MQNNTRWILITSFFITLSIFVGILYYGLLQFSEVRNNSREIVEKNNIKSELVFAMLSSARERVLVLYAMFNSEDSFDRDDLFLELNKQGAIFAQSRSELIDVGLTEAENEILKKQGELTNISVPMQIKLIDLINAENMVEAKEFLVDEVVDAQNLVLDQLST